jgi:hypothetical protein
LNTSNVDVMIDIEALGTNATYPMIAQIGAVLFDNNTGQTVDSKVWNINIKKSHGAIEADTVLFWLGQSREAIDSVFFSSPRIPLSQALADLKSNYIDKAKGVWARSPNFDLRILSDAADLARDDEMPQFKEYIPFRKWRDERVLRDMLDLHGIVVPRVGVGHNALDDALSQVNVVVKARALFAFGAAASHGAKKEAA